MKLKINKKVRQGLSRLFGPAEGTKKSSSRKGIQIEVNTEVEEIDVSTHLSVMPNAGAGGKEYRHCAPEEPQDDAVRIPEGGSCDDSERSDIKPMMARLDALQIQQKIQGMNHPDVLFALKHLARAHRRRGEIEQAKLVEEMLREGQSNQSVNF